jgi:ketosteroid isomerase-like protein
MMKKLLLFPFVVLIMSASGQTVQQEINDQVWKPFLKGFNQRDTKSFLAVHSKDVVRSPRDSKVVWNWDQYYTQQEKGDKRERASNSNRTLELRFTERIANLSQAIEVGVYKTSYTGADGVSKSFYGRFHVVLRKEQGVWKILVDTDSSENNSISEKDYLAAAPMD